MHIRPTPKLRHLCVALMAAMAMPAVAQQSSTTSQDPAKSLDQVTVTGSRIKRAEVEQALPITSFTKDQIDAAGITSAEQLLMQLNVPMGHMPRSIQQLVAAGRVRVEGRKFISTLMTPLPPQASQRPPSVLKEKRPAS